MLVFTASDGFSIDCFSTDGVSFDGFSTDGFSTDGFSSDGVSSGGISSDHVSWSWESISSKSSLTGRGCSFPNLFESSLDVQRRKE